MKSEIITIENGIVSVPQSGEIRMTAFEIAAFSSSPISFDSISVYAFLVLTNCVLFCSAFSWSTLIASKSA